LILILQSVQEDSNSRKANNRKELTTGRSQQQEGANKRRDTNNSRDANNVKHQSSRRDLNSSREATTAEAIVIADLKGRDNSCEYTSTAGPTAAQ
jgi:hypothetical protein